MVTKDAIREYLNIYLQQFPEERERAGIFSGFLDRVSDDGLFSRSNFDGHITSSAFVIDTTHSEILLLRHKSLNRWLQPGGHVDLNDTSILASALRECNEETGIPATELKNVSVTDKWQVPFDIDSHFIPANPMKNEDGHYHHDLRYLFVYTGDGKIIFNADESTGMKWVSFPDLADDDTFGDVVRKITATVKG